jgi:hypothetical protein
MKRKAGAMILLAALSGCMGTGPGSAPPGTFMNHVNQDIAGPAPQTGPGGGHNGAYLMNGAPGLIGPGGVPVMATAPSRLPEMTPENLARISVSQGLPPGVMEQIDKGHRGNSDIVQVSAMNPMGGPMPGGPMPGGPMPGGAMPGGPMMPGMPPMMGPPPFGPPPGAVAAIGALTGAAASPFPVQRTSVRFVGPSGMKISWYGPTAEGKPTFGGDYLTAPGRYNFLQAAIYRLKLTDIPQRAGLDLYPTLEVVPVNAKTATFLAHTSVPISITEEDLNQVAAGNFVVKVIYLPDPQYQDLASAGAEEIISSRLEPGADPIAEALRRGSILLVLRIGNILLELPNTPAMDAPSPFQPHPAAPAGPGMPHMPPGMSGPAGPMPPFGTTGNPRPVPPGLIPQGTLPPDLMPRTGPTPSAPPASGPGALPASSIPVGKLLPPMTPPSATMPAGLTAPAVK